MLKVKTKFRLLSSFHMAIPVMVMLLFTKNAPFFSDPDFQIALTICFALVFFNIMFSPLFFGLRWLFFSQIQQIVSLCSDIQRGGYRYFNIPNEPVEAGDENELISLMRRMNWMVHQIEIRQDVLERRVANRTLELENTNTELVAARDAAKASSNAKGRFLANMSHEIRTPMNAIIGISDLMVGSDLSVQMKEYATIINTSSKDLLKIINGILDFSKIDAGKLDIELVPVNVRSLLEEVADVFKHGLAQKSVELIADINDNVPRQIKTDPLRLKQVITNLVSNAVKFTHQGEVLIRVTAKRPEEQTDAVSLVFSINDTGIGMDQGALDHLFDAFTQADESTSRKFGGTGLGLAISKSLAKLMGGDISVTSTVGKGSCFTLTISTEALEADDPVPVGQQSVIQDKSVLLVVRNSTTGRVIDGFLSAFGFKVSQAFGPVKDNASLFGSNNPASFHLIVLDLDLFENKKLHGEISYQPSGTLPPVIAIGSISNNFSLQNLPLIRAFLSKPVKQSSLFDATMELFCIEKKSSHNTPAPPCAQYCLEGCQILLVEDNRINQILAIEILRSQCIEPVVANCGAQALGLIKERAFDAVIMDVGLPDMDGYETTRRIRQMEDKNAIPVIAMTANAMDQDRAKGLRAGMNEYITKPVDAQILFKVLADLLDKPQKPNDALPDHFVSEENLFGIETLEGIDMENAFKRLNGNQALLHLAVIDFAMENQHTIPKIKKLMQAGEVTELLALIHSFKGVSLNISAISLVPLLVEFEKHVKTAKKENRIGQTYFGADLTAIEQAFSVVCRSAQVLQKKIETREQTRTGENQEYRNPDPEFSNQTVLMVEKMGELLKKNGLDAKVHAALLSKELENTSQASQACTLATQIKRFDFTNARKTFQCMETCILQNLPGTGCDNQNP